MVQSIFINSTNVVYNTDNQTYNKMRFKFSTPVEFKNAKMALGSLKLYYSWFNISSKYGNNSFTYTFRGQTRTFTLADGNYSIDDINELFLVYMRSQNHYILHVASNVATFFASFSANASVYSIQLDLETIPIDCSITNVLKQIPSYTTTVGTTTTTTGYFTAPTVKETMQITIPNTNITKLIGFTTGTYPATVQNVSMSYLSTFTPQINPISAIITTCNLVKQKYSTPNNIFYTFSAGSTAFGDQISIEPNEFQFCDIANGIYEYLDIIFYDQLNRQLEMRDEELIINLLIDLNEDNNK